MRGRTAIQREFWLVSLIVAAGACFVVFASVPVNWQDALDRASHDWGLAVGDTSRWFSRWAFGDGQIFAVIASDPLGSDSALALGDPAYRYARFGYGWFVWLLTLGSTRLIPYAMAVVGATSVLGLLTIARRLRPIIGPSVWLLCLNPAIYLALAGGTAEGLGAFLLAAALSTGNRWWSMAVATVRPTFILAIARCRRLFIPSVVVTLAVVLFVIYKFGWQFSDVGNRIAYPFFGYWKSNTLASWSVLVASLSTLAVGIRRGNASWVVSGAFLLLLTSDIVESPSNAWRAAGLLPVLWAFGPRYRAPVSDTDSRVLVTAGP